MLRLVVENAPRLAIFFWILMGPWLFTLPSGEDYYYLLFSFEFWVANGYRGGGEEGWEKLAIFFWILISQEGENIENQKLKIFLLFSFEFWLAAAAGAAAAATASRTCYFLLNFDRVGRRVSGIVKFRHGLLFSFEFWTCGSTGSEGSTLSRTCYFLLNFDRFTYNLWWVELDPNTCYFLLNFDTSQTGREASRTRPPHLLFSFEFWPATHA